ncbi:phosphopentomutase [Streptomyces sp. NBC_01016]|uniref:phosphopentomutase n=1 Tax=Streptomyces sp. NBC_01016 TaxID=2903720 RepID=UPI00224D3BF5|nr:phosphopentomutase [Streptomyces sp. NBC_01016]MCX4829617.1 phosphopentomutase [Streptomyces sp. NBC_01016]
MNKQEKGPVMPGKPATSKTVIVVVDGFGVGAMPDAGALRPGDLTADTCGHVLDRCREAFGRPLRLPALGALGLGLVHPHPDLARRTHLPVAVGRAALGYPGADTFAGHQTMMGADFSRVTVARLADHLDGVTRALTDAGHRVERLDGKPLLVVDAAVLVHDNLEADPGINWNASGRLDDPDFDLDFDGILSVARTVRAVAPVARVIAVGGHADGPLPEFVRDGDGGTVGLDTPATGFYRNGGLQVQHLGAELDHTRQLPDLAARAGIPVTLVGKAADILACEAAVRRPAVATAEVLAHTLEAVRADGGALVVANVQESDLAGHQQDVERYGRILEQVDAGLAALLSLLTGPGDRLIVTGDHGNDPAIGHAYHTREYVPVLIHRPGAPGVELLPDASSLADVGATAAAALGLDPAGLANGAEIREAAARAA